MTILKEAECAVRRRILNLDFDHVEMNDAAINLNILVKANEEMFELLKLINKNSTNFRLKAPEYLIDLYDATLAKYGAGSVCRIME